MNNNPKIEHSTKAPVSQLHATAVEKPKKGRLASIWAKLSRSSSEAPTRPASIVARSSETLPAINPQKDCKDLIIELRKVNMSGEPNLSILQNKENLEILFHPEAASELLTLKNEIPPNVYNAIMGYVEKHIDDGPQKVEESEIRILACSLKPAKPVGVTQTVLSKLNGLYDKLFPINMELTRARRLIFHENIENLRPTQLAQLLGKNRRRTVSLLIELNRSDHDRANSILQKVNEADPTLADNIKQDLHFYIEYEKGNNARKRYRIAIKNGKIKQFTFTNDELKIFFETAGGKYAFQEELGEWESEQGNAQFLEVVSRSKLGKPQK